MVRFLQFLVAGNKEAQDIAQDAIYQLLSGGRSWDPDAEPDLFAHLQSVIDSKISAFVRGRANKLIRTEAALAGVAAADENQPPLLDTMASPDPSPEEATLAREQERLSDELLIELDQFLEDEPELQRIVEAIVDDAGKPAEIAATLGIDVKAVYNARKRLQSRLRDFRAQRNGTTTKAS